jgi:outer membrane receptor for ferrienterochelin and colicin
MAQLPSLTRNAYDFVALSGNVSNGDSTSVNQGNNNVSGSGQGLTTRGVSFSLNGQRQTGTEILLDGVENVAVYSYAVGENVPIDSVQEYSVITNNFSAEYGRASGGVVNVTTRAGSNQFHVRQRCGGAAQGPVHSQSVWLPGRRPDFEKQTVYFSEYGVDARTKSGKFESGNS